MSIKNKLIDIYYLYIVSSKNQYGPMSFDKITELINSGFIGKNDYIWDNDKNEWIYINTHPDFSGQTDKCTGSDIAEKIDIPDNLTLKGTKIFYKNFRDDDSERYFKRLNFFIPAEIKKSDEKEYGSAKIKNISIGGMAAEIKYKDYKSDDALDIKLFISSLAKYIMLKGVIVRKKKIVTNHYNYGIKFTDIDKSEGYELINILSWKADASERATIR